jgi:hypothetical protein
LNEPVQYQRRFRPFGEFIELPTSLPGGGFGFEECDIPLI